jgi:hypothetical protein
MVNVPGFDGFVGRFRMGDDEGRKSSTAQRLECRSFEFHIAGFAFDADHER